LFVTREKEINYSGIIGYWLWADTVVGRREDMTGN
jgi:hypothetical protein